MRHAHTRWTSPTLQQWLAVVRPRLRAGSRNSQVCTIVHMDARSYACIHTIKFPCSFMHLVQFARSCSTACMFGVHTAWFVCSFTHAIYVWVPHIQSCVHWCTVYHACVVATQAWARSQNCVRFHTDHVHVLMLHKALLRLCTWRTHAHRIFLNLYINALESRCF